MSVQLLWWVGDRQPSISDQITANGVAVDLSSIAAQFKMRAVGSSTLKVNQPVSFKDASGNWRYDWAASDLDTAGQYLVWVETTAGGKVQTVWESLIEVRAHAPELHAYVELEQFKSTAELTSTNFADQEIKIAIAAASRAIDNITDRRFWADADAAQVRYYTPTCGSAVLEIDDLVTLTALATDAIGGTTFATTWTENTHFYLEPLNAAADSRPWETIRIRRAGGLWWPNYPRSVKVTGKFGWAAMPPEIQLACTLIASRLVKRMREAPFGIVAVGIDGAAMRIARYDSDVQLLLGDFSRTVLIG